MKEQDAFFLLGRKDLYNTPLRTIHDYPRGYDNARRNGADYFLPRSSFCPSRANPFAWSERFITNEYASPQKGRDLRISRRVGRCGCGLMRSRSSSHSRWCCRWSRFCRQTALPDTQGLDSASLVPSLRIAAPTRRNRPHLSWRSPRSFLVSCNKLLRLASRVSSTEHMGPRDHPCTHYWTFLRWWRNSYEWVISLSPPTADFSRCEPGGNCSSTGARTRSIRHSCLVVVVTHRSAPGRYGV